MRPCIALDCAEHYFTGRYGAAAWRKATAEEKTSALRTASVVLGAAFQFRDDALVPDSDGKLKWRENILAALCEEALWLMQTETVRQSELVKYGVARASIANIEATFSPTDAPALVCELAKTFVGEYGTYLDPNLAGGSVATTPLSF